MEDSRRRSARFIGALTALTLLMLLVPLAAIQALTCTGCDGEGVGSTGLTPELIEEPIDTVEHTFDTVTATVTEKISPSPSPSPTTSPTPTPSPSPQPPTSGSSDEGSGGSGTGGEATSALDADTGPVGGSAKDAAGLLQQSPLPGSGSSPVVGGFDTSLLFEGAYLPRGGPRSTSEILGILEGLNLPPATMARILAPFPVLGEAHYSDDWGAPRSHPYEHLHEGTDIFAERGTPVIASTTGVVGHLTENAELGGISLRVTGLDGTFFFYAHLERFAPLIYEGKLVVEGEVLGFVGTSGNAEGGPPHLHYQIHPKGGDPVPPVPYLDKWLSEALSTAKALEGSSEGARSSLSALGSLGNLREGITGAAGDLARSLGGEPVKGVSNASGAGAWGVLLLAAGLWWLHRRRRMARVREAPGFIDFP